MGGDNVTDDVLDDLREKELEAVTDTERLDAKLRDEVADTEIERRAVGESVVKKLTVGKDDTLV